jgi:hypothetical protein
MIRTGDIGQIGYIIYNIRLGAEDRSTAVLKGTDGILEQHVTSVTSATTIPQPREQRFLAQL